MNFYPTIKEHISPSAYAAWHGAKGSFVKSYFSEDRFGGSWATKTGKAIHGLIEAGMLDVKHHYEHNELTLIQELPFDFGIVKSLGKPDSFGLVTDMRAEFVDYKSGKENEWDDIELAKDLKMKFTAWLVWKQTGMPTIVKGFIERIPTQWNNLTKEAEPTGEPSEVVAELTYDFKEMEAFEISLRKTIEDVNTSYLEWFESTDEYVNQNDVAEYVEISRQIKALEKKLIPLDERISEGMNMGGKDSISTIFGSFYFRNSKTYEIPKDLPIGSDYVKTLEEAEKVEVAMEVAKARYKTEHDPVKVSKSLSFKVKK